MRHHYQMCRELSRLTEQSFASNYKDDGTDADERWWADYYKNAAGAGDLMVLDGLTGYWWDEAKVQWVGMAVWELELSVMGRDG